MIEKFHRICKGCLAINPAQAKVCLACANPMPQKADVFLSYSHDDTKYLNKLLTHIAALKRSGQVEVWYDRAIDAGAEFAEDIDTHLLTADVILLLVSASFLASEYCYSIEMQKALERHAKKNACVIPVILRPVDWSDTPFRSLKGLPTDGKPVRSWSDEDEALLNVIQGVKDAIAHRYDIHPQRPAR